MDRHNPFSSPLGEPVSSGDSSPPDTLGRIARGIFLAWEKLRLWYIGILTAVTLIATMLDFKALVTSPDYWSVVLSGAVVANLCYFAGPLVETYVTWLDFRVSWLRPLLFILGTLLSVILANVVVLTMWLPNPD